MATSFSMAAWTSSGINTLRYLMVNHSTMLDITLPMIEKQYLCTFGYGVSNLSRIIYIMLQ